MMAQARSRSALSTKIITVVFANPCPVTLHCAFEHKGALSVINAFTSVLSVAIVMIHHDREIVTHLIKVCPESFDIEQPGAFIP